MTKEEVIITLITAGVWVFTSLLGYYITKRCNKDAFLCTIIVALSLTVGTFVYLVDKKAKKKKFEVTMVVEHYCQKTKFSRFEGFPGADMKCESYNNCAQSTYLTCVNDKMDIEIERFVRHEGKDDNSTQYMVIIEGRRVFSGPLYPEHPIIKKFNDYPLRGYEYIGKQDMLSKALKGMEK